MKFIFSNGSSINTTTLYELSTLSLFLLQKGSRSYLLTRPWGKWIGTVPEDECLYIHRSPCSSSGPRLCKNKRRPHVYFDGHRTLSQNLFHESLEEANMCVTSSFLSFKSIHHSYCMCVSQQVRSMTAI